MPCVPIFRKNEQLWLFWPKFAQKSILGSKFQKPKSGFEISILEKLGALIVRQNGQLWIFGLNLPKNGFWGRNFKYLSLDSESTPPIYHECQFSVKMDNFWVFDLNLGKLPNYVQYFGSNIVEGVAESWVEVEMNWMEVDGAGRRWVHCLVIPKFLYCLRKLPSSFILRDILCINFFRFTKLFEI